MQKNRSIHMLKKAEYTIPKRQTSFSTLQEMISSSAFVLKLTALFWIEKDSAKLLLVERVERWFKTEARVIPGRKF